MPEYTVTERQVVEYSWTVTAPTEDAAVATANDGVPDHAASRLISSEVTAEKEGEGHGD